MRRIGAVSALECLRGVVAICGVIAGPAGDEVPDPRGDARVRRFELLGERAAFGDDLGGFLRRRESLQLIDHVCAVRILPEHREPDEERRACIGDLVLVHLRDRLERCERLLCVVFARRAIEEQRGERLPLLAPRVQMFELAHDQLVRRLPVEHALVRGDRALVIVEPFVRDRRELEQERHARGRVVGERDPFFEQVGVLGPSALLHEQRVQRVEHARLAGVDRLRAVPRVDRAVDAAQLVEFDATELDQQLELLVLVGIAPLDALGDELADRVGELFPALARAQLVEPSPPLGRVGHDDLDLVARIRRAPLVCTAAGLRRLRARRQHACKRRARRVGERHQIGDVGQLERVAVAVADHQRDRTRADRDRQDQHCGRRRAELLEQPVDERLAARDAAHRRHPRADRGLECRHRVARDPPRIDAGALDGLFGQRAPAADLVGVDRQKRGEAHVRAHRAQQDLEDLFAVIRIFEREQRMARLERRCSDACRIEAHEAIDPMSRVT